MPPPTSRRRRPPPRPPPARRRRRRPRPRPPRPRPRSRRRPPRRPRRPTGTTIVRAYFFLGSFTDNAGLAPVLREIPKTQAVATAAMKALLAGPNDAELGARPAMYTDIPDGTKLLGLTIKDGVATVDLSAEFESGGGRASILGRLAQVVYTLTQFPTVDQVLFKLDGEPVTVFGGAGVKLDHPVGRDDYTNQLPAIFMDRPACGAALGHPGRVSRRRQRVRGDVPRAAARRQRRRPGRPPGRWRAAAPGAGARTRWTWRTRCPRASTGRSASTTGPPKDGTPENVTEYPVWLTPGG